MTALTLFAEHVDSETARKVATTFLNNNGAKTTQLTDLSKEAGFNNLYIFNGNPGFVVMAADDCVQPILGYSLTGSFEAEGIPENVSSWLQGYSNEIAYAIEHKTRATTRTIQLWKALGEGRNDVARTTTGVAPLIETKWNQNKFYNRLCPTSNGPDGHAYSGCVATAMAQIMKYHEYPPKGVGSHSYVWNGQTCSADFGTTTYDWDNMLDYYEYYYDDEGYIHWLSNPSSDEITAVATLMYHCGVSVNMKYSGNGSGTSTSQVAHALKNYFNYSPGIEYKIKEQYPNDWENMVKAELDANRPLEYCGSDPDEGGGHAFVCDGYDDAGDKVYFHFNWGWAGHYDGYFLLSNLDTGANGEAGSGNGVYTDDQAAVFGIQPVQCDASVPQNLQDSLSGIQNVTLKWTSATGAASYNIYHNNSYIDNTTLTSYNGTASFGTNVYYIRSVDAKGMLSLSSNPVSFYVDYQKPIVDDMEVSLSNNNANITWTEPEWCYPKTPSATLTYGSGVLESSLGTNGVSNMYWGHRYPTSTLESQTGMVAYKFLFYAPEPGTYQYFLYEGTDEPQKQIANVSIFTTEIGWNEIDLTEKPTIDASQDLWVFMYDPEHKGFPASYSVFSDHTNGCYYTFSDPLTAVLYQYSGVAWLINTYLTDGTYTYNLYDGTTKVNGDVPITSTNYTVENITNNTAHQFSVKTNYYGGESPASNMVGLTLGSTSVSDMKLKGNDVMTVTSGSTLTVTGTLENQDPSHLIIKDGAQLIHNSTDVKATVEQFVDPYVNLTDKDGWRFIASPVLEAITPSTDNNLLNGTYDLYYYDEPTYYWKNYRNESFNLVPGQGYLYATNASNDTLQFAGTLTPSNAAVASNTLSFELNGFNLIGNPFACNANIDRDFYVIDNTTHKIVLAATGRTIAPCEGVLVKATANNQTATFSKAGAKKGDLDNELLDLVVTNDKTTLDRIRVRSGKGPGMEKFSLDSPENTRLFLRQDGQDYAVAHIAGQPSMPVQFKASKDGSYTLSIENNLIDLDYLHLIDHLTGMDIDLLQNPSYSFEAHTDDYAARFQLMFSPKANDDVFGDSFVDGKTVVIDMTGRVVATDRNTQLAPGVYIVRTVNGNETTSKKIIINK